MDIVFLFLIKNVADIFTTSASAIGNEIVHNEKACVMRVYKTIINILVELFITNSYYKSIGHNMLT